MDMYSLQRVARIEYEQMVRSLPTVHDFEQPFPPEPSRGSRLRAGLRAFVGQVRAAPPRKTQPSLTISNASPFLREQTRQDSPRVPDWLWAAR